MARMTYMRSIKNSNMVQSKVRYKADNNKTMIPSKIFYMGQWVFVDRAQNTSKLRRKIYFSTHTRSYSRGPPGRLSLKNLEATP